ncbi:MAG: ABC transporter ATP-binding protein [Candidatus Tectomicrobia bacterium]|uniref:ABC transporter ATP-binding protein n=1 Tax=Tectimicrobiota bacterium TaxID=2528274 RepID=A0A937W0Q2_UNCTE|nr:ABC transporter ATP-binding protein [Candidatus Tectomicrobia bacterium]
MAHPLHTGTYTVMVQDVQKSYTLHTTTVRALDGVSLAVAPGEFLAIAGPSGSGKTTLLNLIGCLDTPSAGEVIIDGVCVSQLNPRQRADLRARKLGFIFQTFNLIPVLTAYENVEYPLCLQKRQRTHRSRVETALAQVGLSERAHHRPTELSGGQQQRVAIARALVTEPALVLADEPTANLDSKTGQDIIALLQRLNRERGMTCIFSTHDPRIMHAADRVVEIIDGQLVKGL